MEQKNLIIQTAFLGDLLLAIPLIKSVKAKDPQRKLVLFCRTGFGDFFLKTHLVDEVIEVDKKNKSSFKEASKKLRSNTYQWVISPHESLRTAKLVGALKAEKKIGFKKWWNFLIFNQRIDKPIQMPDALRQLALAKFLQPEFYKEFKRIQLNSVFQNNADYKDQQIIPEWASLKLNDLKNQRTKHNFDFFKPTAILAPGSQWPTKRWGLEGFIKVADTLRANNFQVMLVGSLADKELTQKISTQVQNCIDLAGETTVYDLAVIMAKSQILITNDSGLMHLGSVAGLPTVAIFGPTTLALGYRPWQDHARVVEISLPCRPCGKHGHLKCPIGTHECMKAIPAERVLQELQALVPR